MSNPLALPSITGGAAGPSVAGASTANSGIYDSNFSVGNGSATETITSAFKTTGFKIVAVGGLIFLASIYLKKKL